MSEFFYAQRFKCHGYDADNARVYGRPKNIKFFSFTHDPFSDGNDGELEAFSQLVKCDKLDIDNPVRNKAGDIVRYRCNAIKTPERRGFCPFAIPPPHGQGQKGQKDMEEYVDNLNIVNKELGGML